VKGKKVGIEIRPFKETDEKAVIQLWKDCGLVVPVNDPVQDIRRKKGEHPELFLVALLEGKIVGAVMGGYDGHRGAVNYLGVDPTHRRHGTGRRLMAELEKRLAKLGCPKINLYVRTDNAQVAAFYEKFGYVENTDSISFGKRLVDDSQDLGTPKA
jgi:ribosomal protein S18 acetylase RimI-like enzyme